MHKLIVNASSASGRRSSTFWSLLLFSFFAVSCGSPASPEDAGQAANDPEASRDYLLEGQQIAGTTFTALSSQLKAAMERGGVQEAVSYCQLAAHPITDSLSQVYQADIRRITDRPRNPENAASAAERELMKAYQAQLAQEEKLAPQLVIIDGQTRFYAPIVLMDLCQKCHGTVGETIQEDDYAFIKERYPQDQATGYKSGDLRGLWQITFRD